MPLRIDFVTIFPNMFAPLLAEGVIARGIKQGLLDVRVWDLRDYTTDRHRSTDDEAYGGGPGMVMLGEPVFRCVEAIRESVILSRADGEGPPADGTGSGESAGGPSLSTQLRMTEPHLIMTSPQGRRFDHRVAAELSEKQHVVFLCGRYEGFDHRVHERLQPEEISIGDFVVSGGELPAMLMADAIGRLVPGVVGNSGSVEEDSFFRGLLDYPHYTRPEELRGMRVPDILLSGHHEKIRRWRKEQALRATLEKRPDLLESAELDAEAQEILRRLGKF
ncbi:MAG TPA: tRNA (guanosine(37)-N1)-methyltransferase TrmD [Thermoanaerobaculia bacterium]